MFGLPCYVEVRTNLRHCKGGLLLATRRRQATQPLLTSNPNRIEGYWPLRCIPRISLSLADDI